MSIASRPGQYRWYPTNGPDYFDPYKGFEGCSKYYTWLCDLGYPNLDVIQFEDGEWALIEFYNAPIIPSMTRWNYVLQGIRNVEIGPGFITKYIQELDLHRKEVWERAEAKRRAIEEEHARVEAHAQDTAERAKNIIMNTPTLVERICKNGLHEMNLPNIVKHIPRHQLIGHKSVELVKGKIP